MDVRLGQRRDLLAFEDRALGQAALAAPQQDVRRSRPQTRRAGYDNGIAGVLVSVVGRENECRPPLVQANPIEVAPLGRIHLSTFVCV
jgi:hypothetical protein